MKFRPFRTPSISHKLGRTTFQNCHELPSFTFFDQFSFKSTGLFFYKTTCDPAPLRKLTNMLRTTPSNGVPATPNLWISTPSSLRSFVSSYRRPNLQLLLHRFHLHPSPPLLLRHVLRPQQVPGNKRRGSSARLVSRWNWRAKKQVPSVFILELPQTR